MQQRSNNLYPGAVLTVVIPYVVRTTTYGSILLEPGDMVNMIHISEVYSPEQCLLVVEIVGFSPMRFTIPSSIVI